jgi:hypothetical protein
VGGLSSFLVVVCQVPPFAATETVEANKHMHAALSDCCMYTKKISIKFRG